MSGLRFTDEEFFALWNRPQGWGGPWVFDSVAPNTPSDPYLLTGFVNKVAHFRVEANDPFSGNPLAGPVTITIQIDFLGYATLGVDDFVVCPWNNVTTVTVQPGGYNFYVFPTGLSAHWVRFITDSNANATAYLTYTP
jgi:hypothetical protein